jgi:hypothetical protein
MFRSRLHQRDHELGFFCSASDYFLRGLFRCVGRRKSGITSGILKVETTLRIEFLRAISKSFVQRLPQSDQPFVGCGIRLTDAREQFVFLRNQDFVLVHRSLKLRKHQNNFDPVRQRIPTSAALRSGGIWS